MNKIEWQPAYSVGVRELDAQHQRIVELVNVLIDNPDVRVGSETVSTTLTQLTEYASQHFETEEGLLKEHGYPDVTAHMMDHRWYRAEIVAMCEAAMRYDAGLPTTLIAFLRNWWLNHIQHTDMAYKGFFAEKGVD